MKVKPYRVCDICKKEYQKRHGCLKIKRFYVPGWDWYGETHSFTNMDICPECGEMLLEVVRMAKEDLGNDRIS